MKNVLILGATSDIAQAMAKKYAAEGWSLTLAAKNTEALAAVAGDLRVRTEAPVETKLFEATDFAAHKAWYASLTAPPDVVIAAFGYMSDQALVRSDIEDIQRTIDINFTGMATILSVIAEDFEKRGEGAMVAISSVAGDRGRQSNYIYGSAKAGLTAFLSGLRNRLIKRGVHVMTVKPGFCRTKMTEGLDLPGALTSTPEQVAEAVFKGLQKKRNTVYVLWMWRYIMWIIRHIPESIFKKHGM